MALTLAGMTPSEAKPPEPAAPPSSPATTGDLPGLDTAALDDGQKRWLNELMEKYPSPCGKPHSLLTSLKTDPGCKRSPFGARYLVSLLKAGLLRSECEEHYERRFVSPETGRCDFSRAPLKGDPKAPVALCEFSDFQCPHCRLLAPMLSRIVDELPGRVRLYYKNYPITRLHPDARDAAAAAMAASLQGHGKFWQMHDKLFANQDKLSAADLERYAAELKLDVRKWKADLQTARERVDQDRAEGEKLDVAATPTLYINGRKYSGPHRYDEVKDWVEEELSRHPQ